jgi:hypothetical protein
VDKEKKRNKETAAAVRKCVLMFDVSRCVRIWIFSLLPYEQKEEIQKKMRNFVIMIANSTLFSLPIKVLFLFSNITYQFRYEEWIL